MRTPLFLFLLALAVRLVFLGLFPDPAYPDSYYYVEVANALRAGHGFNIDFIWVFVEVGGRIPAVPHLPIPSNAHWMPLASIVQVPFLYLFGGSAFVAGLPFAITGSVAAPLTWAIAREAGSRPAVQLGAGILIAIPAAAVFMAQPDNFSLYQPLVAGALWMTARGLKGRPWSFAFAGLLVGLATLARNDGVLVGAAVAIVFAWDRWRAWRAGRSGMARPLPMIPFWAAIACFGLFLVVMAPWFARQLAVFGSLSPSASSGRVLFIRSMRDFNSVTSDVSIQGFLGQGIGPLIESRVLGLVAAISIYAVLVGAVVLTPFMVIGGWLRRRSIDFGPFFLYAAILFAFSAIVSAIHVPGGTFIHSAVALAPHSDILALEGITASVGWVARRRRSWNPGTAVPVFLGAAVVLTIGMSAVYGLLVQGGWKVIRSQREAVATELNALGAGPNDRLMSIDPGGYRYYTGRGGVVTPDDSMATIETVAHDYDIRWLILERDQVVRAMAPVLKGTSRPAWIGAPVWTLQQPTDDPELAGYPAVAIYPICTGTNDLRCALNSVPGAPGAGGSGASPASSGAPAATAGTPAAVPGANPAASPVASPGTNPPASATP
ncbi:MAG TPA: glycosyltransferase family 39 protein [Candidatus Saccharimonadales bacterium]|nr:glycosyltransferase family 39 protein [Candidatus Saccharimonadales bacterium]